MVTLSVLVHGPPAVVEKAPCAELELKLTVTALVALVCSCTVMAAEGLPAMRVCGAVAKASVGVDQYWSVFQASLNQAPSICPPHHRFRPSGPQAPLPGSLGS